MNSITKIKFTQCLVLAYLLFFVPLESIAQTTLDNYISSVKSWQRKYCTSSHLGKLSDSIKEEIGGKFRVNPNKVDFKRFNLSFDECIITLYSEKGPITCQIIFSSDGKGGLTPCPFNEPLGSEYAAQRFNNIGARYIGSQMLGKPKKYIDPFEGTSRAGGL